MSDADLPKPPDGEAEPAPPAPPSSPFLPAPAFMLPPRQGAAAGHFEPPRLRILHLLIWTAVAAMLFKLNMALTMMGHAHADSMETAALQVVPSLSGILKAAGLVGLGALLTARLRGASGRFQPGHWMLVAEAPIDALTTLCQLALGFVVWTSRNNAHASPGEVMTIVMLVAAVPAGLWRGVVYFAASRRTKDGRRWNVLFLCLAILAVSPALWLIPPLLGTNPVTAFFLIAIVALQLLFDATVCVTFLVMVLMDLRNPRDWLHWLGVVLGGCGTVASAVPCLPFAGTAWMLRL